MSPPNTDPFRSVVNDTDPSSEPATTVDESDASVTRELASSSVTAAMPGRHARRAATGTDPGLGSPKPAPDTIVDVVDPTVRRWDDDTWDDDDNEDVATDERIAMEAQLKRLGGRAPQLATYQADSAGRGAAIYDVVTKPVKSRAVSRTDPYGVIVAPDTNPPTPTVAATANELASNRKLSALTERLDSLSGASEEVPAPPYARSKDRATTTSPGASRSKAGERRQLLLLVGAGAVLLLMAIGITFGLLRDGTHPSDLVSHGTPQLTAPPHLSTLERRSLTSAPPRPATTPQPSGVASAVDADAPPPASAPRLEPRRAPPSSTPGRPSAQGSGAAPTARPEPRPVPAPSAPLPAYNKFLPEDR